MISGWVSTPSFFNSSAAPKMARVCICVISGYVFPKRQPRWPNIGLCSHNDSTRCWIYCRLTPIVSAISCCPFKSWGTNSCKGGSSKRTVTGQPAIALKMPLKSSCWYGRILANALRRPSAFSARIISRIALIFSPSKNMCSVRQRPIPTAPKLRATSASWGVSAFVRTCRRVYLSASVINSAKSPESSAACVSTLPL